MRPDDWEPPGRDGQRYSRVVTLRIGGVPEHFNLPFRLALEESPRLGSWRDQFGGTGEMLAGLEQGDLDIASILTEGTVAAIRDGLAATIIQVYVSSPLQWGIHVPASSDIADRSELPGRPIAISRPRSGSHLMAYVLADVDGWAVADDQLVAIGGLAGARESMAAGRTETFLWDRFMTQPFVDNGEFRRIGVLPTPWPSFVIAARNDVLLGRTADVGALVDAVVAQAAALHQRPNIVDELAARYEISPASAAGWLETTTFAPRSAFDPRIAETVLDTLASAGFT